MPNFSFTIVTPIQDDLMDARPSPLISHYPAVNRRGIAALAHEGFIVHLLFRFLLTYKGAQKVTKIYNEL